MITCQTNYKKKINLPLMQLFLSQCWVTGFSHDDGWTGCLSSAGYWKWGKQILFCHGRPLMTWAASCTVSQAGWGPFLHLSPQSEGNDTGEPRGGISIFLLRSHADLHTHKHTHTKPRHLDDIVQIYSLYYCFSLARSPGVHLYISIFSQIL